MLTLTGVRLWQGWAWLQRGDLVEAEQSLRWYLEATVDRAGEGEVGLGYGLGFLARTLVERGDIGAARRLGVHVGVRSPGSDGDLQYRRAMVELLLTEGRWAEALEAVDALPLRRRPVVNPAWAPFDALATRALCALGRPDEARVRAERGVAAARQWGSPSALGPSLRALGLALGAQRPARSSGSTDDAVDVFREAVASTDGSLARLEHAKSTLALGSALRRRRAPSDARPVLELAVDLATGCGAGRARHRGAHTERAPGRRPGRHWHDQQGHRPRALHHPQNRRDPPVAHLPQAGRLVSGGAGAPGAVGVL